MTADDRAAIEKHLDLCQGVITRMASNSFLLKGWALTVIVGLAAWLASVGAAFGIFLLLLPLGSFWLLDAYFLQQERIFRKVYDRVVKQANLPEGEDGALVEAPALPRYQLKPPLEIIREVNGPLTIALDPFEGAPGRNQGSGVPVDMLPLNTIFAFHAPLAVLVILLGLATAMSG